MPRRGSIEESIYDLIPKPKAQVVKPPMHRSKYPHDTTPTGSTFGAANSSQIAVTNISGDYADIKRVHNHKSEGAHMGKQNHYSDPTKFLKKQTHGPLAQPKKFVYAQTLKPPVDARRPKAVAAREKKDYITQNALAAITSEAKKRDDTPKQYTKKADYGKKPAYLDRVKNEISQETEYIKQIMEAENNQIRSHQPQLRQLPEEERLDLLKDLKEKWSKVNQKYQLGAHTTRLDTIGKIRRKEQHEQELKDLETAIAKMSRSPVYIQDGMM
jgi:hypothetical protein